MGARFSKGQRKSDLKEKATCVYENGPNTPFVSEKEMHYLTQMLQFVNDDRKKGKFCDTIVASRNKYFKAHSIILACNSHLFRNIAEKHKQENKKRITICMDSIHPHIFELLLEYIYTGKLFLRKTTVAEVSMAAMDLKIPSICNLCNYFIKDMDSEQALLILLTRNICPSNDVFRKALCHVEDNFSVVVKHKLYMKLNSNVLEKILSSDNLNVRWELEVLDNLLKWTYHSHRCRRNYFPQLVKSVRFTQMTLQELRCACTMAEMFRVCKVYEAVINEAIR
ncbi:kelch-like protein 20 [Argonauta hians]